MEHLDGRTQDVIRKGIEYLAGVCDHAQSHDNEGFSANTAGLGHELARLPDRYWNDGTYVAAARLVRHHRMQAIKAGVLQDEDVPTIEMIANGAEEDVASAWMARDDLGDGVVLSAAREMADVVRMLKRLPGASQPAKKGRLWVVDARHSFALARFMDRFTLHGDVADLIRWSARNATPEMVLSASEQSIQWTSGEFALSFPYDPNLIYQIKALPDRRFDGKNWMVTPSRRAAALLAELLASHGFLATPEAIAAIEAAKDLLDTEHRGTRNVRSEWVGDRIKISFKYAPDIVEAIKQVDKSLRSYDSLLKSWMLDASAVDELVQRLEALKDPISPQSLETLKEKAPGAPVP